MNLKPQNHQSISTWELVSRTYNRYEVTEDGQMSWM